jgi:hypothetical protein
MPKPYHTPKSERDEEIGALTEAEELDEAAEDTREPRFVEVHSATITRTYTGGDTRTRRVTLVNTPHSVGELFPPNHPLWGNWRITAMVYCGMIYNVHSV